jgi:tetratricopeptide (TPR) repeat protein
VEDLRGIIKVLRPGEKRLLKHILTRKVNAEDALRLKLFQTIDSALELNEFEIRMKACPTSSDSSFSHLKRRLMDDILGVLLIKESTKRIAQANRAATYECWRKLVQAYVLIFRGAKREGAHILESAKALAKEYELSAELVLINHVVREALYGQTNADELLEINNNLRKELGNLSDILRAEELSFVISLPQLKERLLKDQPEGFEERMVEELKVLYGNSQKGRVGFWYYMADLERQMKIKNYNEALRLGKEFLQLIEQSPSVRSKTNIAGVSQSLGLTHLLLRQYPESVSALLKAAQLFPQNGFNRLTTLELMAQAYAAQGDTASALVLVESALKHPRIKAREHLVPKWLFIRASIEFLAGNVEGAFKTLNQDGYLMKQRDEWNVQFRLLEMLILVEQKDEEWLQFKIDTTRKFLTRNSDLVSLRIRASIDILSNLLRKELDFGRLSDRSNDALQNCLTEAEGYEWDPTGPELVRIDRWVASKLS